MTSSAAELDRRLSDRLQVGYMVECIVDGVTGSCLAEIENVSTTGVFVWMQHDLQLGSRFELVITPEAELNDSPFTMIVEVVRRVEERDGRFGYGCILLDTTLEEETELALNAEFSV